VQPARQKGTSYSVPLHISWQRRWFRLGPSVRRALRGIVGIGLLFRPRRRMATPPRGQSAVAHFQHPRRLRSLPPPVRIATAWTAEAAKGSEHRGKAPRRSGFPMPDAHINLRMASRTGMPAFHSLEQRYIKAVVNYLRTCKAQRRAGSSPGDAGRGEDYFSFGETGCGRLPPCAGKAVSLLLICQPTLARIPWNKFETRLPARRRAAIDQARMATATIRTAKHTTGGIRNEDNFSVQLQTAGRSLSFPREVGDRTVWYTPPQTPTPSRPRLYFSPGELKRCRQLS